MTEPRKTLSIKTSSNANSGGGSTVVKRKRRHHHKPGSSAAAASQAALSARAEVLKKSRENGNKNTIQGQTFTPVFDNKPKKVEAKKEEATIAPRTATANKRHTPKKEFNNDKPSGGGATSFAPKKTEDAKAKGDTGNIRGKINTSKASAMASDGYQGHRRS